MPLAAYAEVGTFSKDSVEMCAYDDERCGRTSFEQSETVSFVVDRNFLQTELPETFGEIFGALLFGEWRCRDRADANVFVGDPVSVGVEKLQRAFDRWRCRELPDRLDRSSFE